MFKTKIIAGTDKIIDFVHLEDEVQLSSFIFTSLKSGKLSTLSFVFGNQAKDADDFILYEAATGTLYYDADGSGKGAALRFAQVKPGILITHQDFFIA